MIGAVVGQMGAIDDIGRRIGVINTVAGVGTICGPPISGLFATSALGYTAVGYFAGAQMPVLLHLRNTANAIAPGSALLVGSALMFVSRMLAAPGIWRKY